MLREITENNHWYAMFLNAVKECYHKSVWKNLIEDCNSDIWLFGYEHTKRQWSKFMNFHYPAEKEVEMLTTQAHIQYKLADGTLVPGVTTVLNILDKGGLIHWAWECGMQGLDYREVRDSAGRVGTLAHQLIASHLKGEGYQPLACSPEEIERAKKCFTKYLAWEKENPIVPVIIETPFVSEEFKFGGTPDLLAEINGEFVLIDFKTGASGIYPGMFAQLSAYWKLLQEQGWPVANARILRISADESDAPEEKIKTNLNIEWEIFLHCLAIYQLHQQERTLCS